MRRPIFPTLLALLAALLVATPLLATAQADTAWETDLWGQQVQLDDVTGTSAPLRALFFDPQEKDESPTVAPAFTLRAKQLDLEIDYADPVIGSLRVDADTDRVTRTEATLESEAVRQAFALTIHARTTGRPPTVDLTETCTTLEPSDIARERRITQVQDPAERPSYAVNLEDALRWTPRCPSALEIRGDFVMSLWQWDAVLGSQDHAEETIQTGILPSQYAPPGTPEDLTLAASRHQEIFVQVTEGVLTIPAGSSTPMRLYLGTVTIDGAADLLLPQASGTISDAAGIHEVAQADVDVHGVFHGTIQGSAVGQPFWLHLRGRPDHLVLDGQPVPVDPARPSADAAWWLVVAIGAPVAVVAAAVVLTRRGLLPFYGLHTLRLKEFAVTQATRHQRPRLGLLLVSIALRRSPGDGDAYSIRAWCLAMLGRAEEAFADFDHAQRLFADHATLAGESAYVAAEGAAMLGDDARTRDYLLAALDVDPRYEEKVAGSLFIRKDLAADVLRDLDRLEPGRALGIDGSTSYA